MKYRKKPVVIDAVQFNPMFEHRTRLPNGVDGIPSHGADNWAYLGCEFFIETLEGRMKVSPGDWVICGVNGEYDPCKDEIFQKTIRANQITR